MGESGADSVREASRKAGRAKRCRLHLTTALATSTLAGFVLVTAVQAQEPAVDGFALRLTPGASPAPVASQPVAKAAPEISGPMRGTSGATRGAARTEPLFAGTIRGSVPMRERDGDNPVTGSLRGQQVAVQRVEPSPEALFQQALRNSIPLRAPDDGGPQVEVGSETLYFDAARNSMRLKASHAQEDAARAEVRAAKGAFLPQISVGGDWVLQGTIDYSPALPSVGAESFARKPGSTLSASLVMPLFDGMRRTNALRAAQANAAASRRVTNDTQQQVYLETASAALAVLRDRKIVRLREQAVDQRRKILHAAERMFEERAVTRSDVALAAARVDAAMAGLESSRGRLMVSESQFLRLTSHQAPSGMVVTPPMALPVSAEEAVLRAKTGNPKLQATKLAAVASKHQSYSELAAFLPSGNLVVEAGRRYDAAPGIDRAEQMSTLLRVRVPIFDGMAVPKYEAAKADARKKMFEAQDGVIEVAETARNLFTQRQAIVAQINVLSRQIGHARAAAKGMMIEREAGLRKISEVLDAEGLIGESEIGMAEAEYERDRTAFMMLAAAGELVPPSVGK